MGFNLKLPSLVQTCHRQSRELSGHLTRLLPVARQTETPHSKGIWLKMEIH